MIEIIKAIILGLIQGITEWLPISSTGHMILFNEFFPLNVSEEFMNFFLVIIQLSSIIAVCIIFFKKLNPFTRDKERSVKTWKLWSKVLIASVPAGIVGVLFDDAIDAVLYNAIVVALALIIYGILFIAVENADKKVTVQNLDELSYKQAFGIGLFQMLALIPGTSRSGSTILGSTLLGCARDVAAEFSFFMAIPVMFGASALKLLKFILKSTIAFTNSELIILAVGCVISFVVSIIVIKLFMKYIKKHDFKVFGVYRIILGIAIIAYFIIFKV